MNNENQHIPVGYKSSPLGIIPEDWEVKRLGEVCDISIGRDVQINHFSEYMTNDYKYPVYSNTVEGEGLYGYYNYEEYSQGKVTVVGRGVGLGTSFARDCGFGAIGRLVVLTPKEKLSTHYLESYINNKVHFFVESAAIPQLTGEHIASYKIAIPSLSEQKKIETYIQLWDTAISKQTALIEKLILRKKGLMQQLLTGKKRLKGFEGEWKEVRLGEVGIFFKGSGVPKDSIIKKGHKCLTYGDLYTKYDYVILNVESFIDDNTASISTRIQYGDICFAGSGETKEDIGKCAAFIDDKIGYAGGDIIVFRANDFNPITLSYILNSENVIKQKSNMGQGHSVVHIYPYQLEKLTFKMPTRKEQNAIASILIQADKEIELANKKLTRLQEEKKGLMQVLLTGKKRVK